MADAKLPRLDRDPFGIFLCMVVRLAPSDRRLRPESFGSSAGKRDENESEAFAAAPEPARNAEAATSFAEAAAGLFDAETQILPDRVQKEKAAPPEAAAPAAPDLRLVALRNLLKSMTEDAASPEIRDHLQRMMELADSVPAIGQPKAVVAQSTF
eukprot:s1483_g20.t1